MNAQLASVSVPSVLARAPGKVNLLLRVGPVREDGYHPLVTVFQAVDLSEDVRARPVRPGSGISLRVSGPQSQAVPVDESNLAWRAAAALARYAGVRADVALDIDKSVPVAGGMAGGSADAAAALVACDALWGLGRSRAELAEVAAGLGADVPFALMGHTAVGTGRGDVLTPAMTRGEFHWAFAVSERGLSTAEVFRAFDERGRGVGPGDTAGPGTANPDDTAGPGTANPGDAAEGNAANPDDAAAQGDRDDTAVMQALRAGDVAGLGRSLRNDLEPVALALRPELRRTMAVARDAEALGVVVSGSGPTIAALARSRRHALAIAAEWTARGVADAVYCTRGPAPGARVVAR